MSKARYICFEGTEGVGKTTQCDLLVKKLLASGYKVLQTKEPGSIYSPLTMVLRTIMLDKQYDDQLTIPARELISQAIRSIHIEKVVKPALDTHDFVVQDRGMLSGLAYGTACGNSQVFIRQLMDQVMRSANLPPADKYDEIHGGVCSWNNLYTDVVYLQGNVAKGLAVAQSSKQEFKAGDAIEAKGVNFMQDVSGRMEIMSQNFNGVRYINVDGKTIEQVSTDIMEALELTGNK